MSGVIIAGAQWGDEGKATVVDFFSTGAVAVVRFNGGSNAGHTVVVGDKKYILHSVPVGILRENTLCLIANGTVVPLSGLSKELLELQARGIKTDSRVVVSEGAQIILPCHLLWEEAMETRRGRNRIDTTKRGIAPAYMAKAGRFGIRAGDLLFDVPSLRTKIERLVSEIELYTGQVIDLREMMAVVLADRDKLLPLVEIHNTSKIINDLLKQGKVIFEGAQGTLLDINFGTWPYVTSSSAIAGGVCSGVGVGPTLIERVILVVKAYTTRVGGGPFPTEETGEIGNLLRTVGGEYGATTGRDRRCGWLDLPALLYAIEVNGATSVALTKLDVLGCLGRLKQRPQICVAYNYGGQRLDKFPTRLEVLRECRPIFEEMPGWSETDNISSARQFGDLPPGARDFVCKLQHLLGVSIELISVGPGREQKIRL